MSGILPDLDEAISFTVDDGAQAGPFTMRTIIDSIRQGIRAPASLVWWAGEPEWVPFSTRPDLMELLQELPATNQPPPPGAEPAPPEATEQVAEAEQPEATEQREASDQSAEAEQPEASVGEFESPAGETDESTAVLADKTLDEAPLDADASVSIEQQGPDWFDEVMSGADDSPTDIVTGGLLEQTGDGIDTIGSAEVEWTTETDQIEVVGADPIPDMAPDSTSFAAPEVTNVEIDGDNDAAAEVEVDATDVAEADHQDQVRDAVEQLDPRLGLFGAGAGTAKMDPLSADRSNESSEESDASASADPDPHLELVADAPLQAVPDPVVDTGSGTDTGDAATESSMPDVDSDELETHFAELLLASGEHHGRLEWADNAADVLHGALITSTLDNGLVLIDQISEGAKQLVRFEDPDDASRVTMAIEQISRPGEHIDIATHLASVAIGWGQRVADPAGTLSAIEAEANGPLPKSYKPGTVGVDADPASGYAYTTVELILPIEDFVAPDYAIDRPALTRTVSSSIHSLRKYWSGRFTPPAS